MMTLAPPSIQALPVLNDVPTAHSHEFNAELVYDLCAALLREGLGGPETWQTCGESAILFAQRAITEGIGEESWKLLERNVEYHLNVSDVAERDGEDALLGDGRLAATIECSGPGFVKIRTALPIRPIGDTKPDNTPSAADGQLGGIIKAYRDWRISGDTVWLRDLWPKIRASLNYCIETWDPERQGSIREPHLNTYDVEFWGSDSMCTSLYLGALKAATLMGESLGENIEQYSVLLSKGIRQMEEQLFNGEYFFQKTEWKNLLTPFPRKGDEPMSATSPAYPELLEIERKEGPHYQYGQGCLSDGVLGEWLCFVAGVDGLLDRHKVENHLMAVHRYNLKKDLTDNANVCRSVFACGDESGLLVCTWPKGGRPSLPVVYADEVWTGIEYQHWYARSMSSYALLQAFSGARFDAVDKILYLKPAIKGNFRCFLSTATGFGTVGVKDGQPFVEVISGDIPYTKIKYTAV
jgi:hypothetical protein